MNKGYVYVLSNPAMPGMVKIGQTKRSVRLRSEELFQTGVPLPFQVEHEVLCPDCISAERWVHEKLAPYRVTHSREFFHVSSDEVKSVVDDCRDEQIDKFLSEFMPDFMLIDGQYLVDGSTVAKLAKTCGIAPQNVDEVLGNLRFEDLAWGVVRAGDSRYFNRTYRHVWERAVDIVDGVEAEL